MDAAYLHLVLNHLPAVGILTGLGVGAWALLVEKPDALKAALGVFVMAALLAGATYLTGEEAEDAVEGLPGVYEATVEAHEEVALYGLVGAGVLGVLALGVLAVSWGRPVRPGLGAFVLLVALAASGALVYTAKLGGEIRHTQLRDGAAPAYERVHDDD